MGYIKDVWNNYFSPINNAPKQNGEQTSDTVLDPEEALRIQMEEQKMIELSNEWISDWQGKTGDLQRQWKVNEKNWLGKRNEDLLDGEVGADNRIFMAFETFLPIATKENPDAVVTSFDKATEVKRFTDLTREILSYYADVTNLKQKLRSATRDWGLYKVGILKVGYDALEKALVVRNVRPQKIILDPDATIGGDGYTGAYVGEVREDRAEVLIERFPKKKDFIKQIVNEKMGTKVVYHEFWTDEVVFWVYKRELLGKMDNPYFDSVGVPTTTVDENGAETQTNIPFNHFVRAKKPYFFLSVFNLGKHPWDDTSLFEQVIPLQEVVHKRAIQIDRNADNANAGMILSGQAFTKEQAKTAVKALRRGESIIVPNGDVNSAVRRDTGTPLQPFIYQNLQDSRNEIDNIFGTHSTTRGEQATQETASGRVLLKGQDEGRIAFVTAYLEQVADQIYNYWTQIVFTLFTQDDVADILGSEKAMEWDQVKQSNHPRVLVSVKENSMAPQDPLTERNSAVELAQAGLLDPLTMFERIDDPNPMQSYERLIKFKMDPMSLMPQAAQQQVIQGADIAQVQ